MSVFHRGSGVGGEGAAEPRRGGAAPSPGAAGGPVRPKQRRYSAARKAELIASYRLSGQTMAVFCGAQGLSTASLCKWLRREERGGEAGLSPRPNPRNTAGRHRPPFRPAERIEAVEAYRRSGLTKALFCARWGISVSSLTKWSQRYDEGGPKALSDAQGRKPSKTRRRGSTDRPARGLSPIPAPKAASPTSPGADSRSTGARPEGESPTVREVIVATKRAEPGWGLRKIRDWLARFGGVKVSASSVRRVLAEEGIAPVSVPKKRKRSSDRVRRFERARPGQLWQTDITSYVLPRSGRRVYLTVFLDDCSRYIVSWNLATHQRAALVIEALTDGLTRFGKPEEVLTDQGPQYHTWRGKSAFHKLLMKEGIGHVVSRSHHPQTLGKCERLWKTIGTELWERVGPRDVGEARQRMGHWIAHYNHFRPHQGIDGLVPADRFFESEGELRAALEGGLSPDELGVALADPVRSRVYLFGRIGEQSVSLHGEQGRLVVETSGGPGQQLDLERLGVPSGAQTQETKGAESDDGRDEATQGGWSAQAQTHDGGEASDADAGAVGLGGGQRGAAADGSPALCDDHRDMGGPDGSAGGGRRPGHHAAASVAAESAGAGGDAGRPGDAAETSREGGDGRSAERREGAEEARGAAGEGAVGGDGSDHDPAGDADASGGRGGGATTCAQDGGEGQESAPEAAVEAGLDERGEKGGAGARVSRWRRAGAWAAGWLRGRSPTASEDSSRSGSP
ncbi:MAG: IS3 family transposase [Planctomycetota bacterium]|nr:MAG: IS3 family transposase [Planctomycetota bacterium]